MNNIPGAAFCPDCGLMIGGIWVPNDGKKHRRRLICPRGSKDKDIPVCGREFRANIITR